MKPPLGLGDRVRLRGPYRLPIPPEIHQAPELPKGTQGTVVRCLADSLWVQMDGHEAPVTFWFPDAFPETFAKTSLLEKIG